jgi:hypothetical protein
VRSGTIPADGDSAGAAGSDPAGWDPAGGDAAGAAGNPADDPGAAGAATDAVVLDAERSTTVGAGRRAVPDVEADTASLT